jgi:hypothetical protein
MLTVSSCSSQKTPCIRDEVSSNCSPHQAIFLLLIYGVTCDRIKSKNCSPISRVRRRPKKHHGQTPLSRHLSNILLSSDCFAISELFLRMGGLMQMYRAAEFFNIACKFRRQDSPRDFLLDIFSLKIVFL